jgi:hypothetical protein
VIWLVLLIPLLVMAGLAIFKPHHMTWWEYAIVLAVPLFFTVTVRSCSMDAQTDDLEWWHTTVVKAQYDEAWSELVTYNCGTKKHRRTCTRTVYHPPSWRLIDDAGQSKSVNSSTYSEIRNTWGVAPDYSRLHFAALSGGGRWTVTWNGDTTRLVPLATEHTWENRIHAARSVFGYSPVDTSTVRTLKLHDYPTEWSPLAYPHLLGADNPVAENILRKTNARVGSKAQLSMYLLVFPEVGPSAGRHQEAYWEGGNKNEFVVCVGTKGNKITWTHVFSWTPNQKLKIQVRDSVRRMDTLDLPRIATYLATDVPPQWKRREFKEFSYIDVKPTPRAIMLAFVLSVLASGLLAWFAISNNHYPSWVPRVGTLRKPWR